MRIFTRVKNFIQSQKRRKERFLYCCAYRFFLAVLKEQTKDNSVDLMPFIVRQQHRDIAHRKATHFIQQAIKERTINKRYQLAMQWAKYN